VTAGQRTKGRHHVEIDLSDVEIDLSDVEIDLSDVEIDLSDVEMKREVPSVHLSFAPAMCFSVFCQ